MLTNVKYALLECFFSPVLMSSISTFTPTSIEVLNALFTEAFRETIFPSLIGSWNERSSTAAVTATLLQWRAAAIAAAISIQCISLPPSRLFSMFVSFGSTSSIIVTCDFFINLGSGLFISYLDVWLSLILLLNFSAFDLRLLFGNSL